MSRSYSPRACCEPLEERQFLSADLAISFSDPFPTVVSPVKGASVKLRVKNLGDEKSAGHTVAIYASADGLLDPGDTLVGTVSRGKPLRPGKSAKLKAMVNDPATLPDGNYQLLALVSNNSGIVDADPGNEVAAGPVPVLFRHPFVDFGVAVTGEPTGAVSTVARGGHRPPSATVSADVFNAGNITAEGQISIGLYLSADGMHDSSDISIAAVTTKRIRLRSGQVKSFRLNFRLPPSIAAGSYSLLASLGLSSELNDAQGGNNLAAGPRGINVVNTAVSRPPRFHRYHHRYYFGGGDVFVYDDRTLYEGPGESTTSGSSTSGDGSITPYTPPIASDDSISAQTPTDPSTQPSDESHDSGGNSQGSGDVDYTGGEIDPSGPFGNDSFGGDFGDSGEGW